MNVKSLVKRNYKKHPKCDHVANNVMKNGILLGCHQGMKKNEIKIDLEKI